MPAPSQKKVTAKDLHIKIDPPTLPYVLVVDGAISFSTLRTLGRDKIWLEKKLNITSKKDYKNIILAIYNKEQDDVNVSYKTNQSK